MPGAERLGMCQELMSLLEKQRESGRIWSAICASPAVVFEAQGWLEAKKATCHPAFVERLADQRCAARHSYHTACDFASAELPAVPYWNGGVRLFANTWCKANTVGAAEVQHTMHVA